MCIVLYGADSVLFFIGFFSLSFHLVLFSFSVLYLGEK